MKLSFPFRSFFNQFGFLYGRFLNTSYKSLSSALGNLINLDFVIAIDRIALIKRLQNFYPLRALHNAKLRYPDEPFLHIYQSGVANYPHIVATGKSFHSEIEAATRAFFEALERYSYSDFLPDDFIEDSFEHVKDTSLNIFALAGFSREQRERSRPLQFDERARFRFFKGECLTDQNTQLIPLQLVSSGYFWSTADFKGREEKDGRFREPVLRPSVTTGVAAGLSKKGVIYGGMLEVIERDAFMITYLNKTPRALIDLEKTEITIHGRQIIDYFKDFDLELYAVRLLSDIPVHTIAVFIIDRTGKGPALSMGASAHHNLQEAILKAAGEALTSRLFNKAHKLFTLDVHVPYETFRQKERKIFWSKPENLPSIQFFMDAPKEIDAPTFEIEGLRPDERAEYLIDIFRKKNYAVYYADIAPPFLGKLGIEVGKVIIPEMQPMHLNEAYPFFGGERIRSVPRSLGYAAAREINTIPHPFH